MRTATAWTIKRSCYSRRDEWLLFSTTQLLKVYRLQRMCIHLLWCRLNACRRWLSHRSLEHCGGSNPGYLMLHLKSIHPISPTPQTSLARTELRVQKAPRRDLVFPWSALPGNVKTNNPDYVIRALLLKVLYVFPRFWRCFVRYSK